PTQDPSWMSSRELTRNVVRVAAWSRSCPASLLCEEWSWPHGLFVLPAGRMPRAVSAEPHGNAQSWPRTMKELARRGAFPAAGCRRSPARRYPPSSAGVARCSQLEPCCSLSCRSSYRSLLAVELARRRSSYVARSLSYAARSSCSLLE
ncbi:hypothetical protein Dimus_022663, partial [Dionaea muscipula]